MKQERTYGPDLVRSAAVTLVIAVHFFANVGFYDQPMAGGAMAVATLLRMCCMTCVPLFLLLSGYLCTGRKWSRTYPVGLAYVLAVYVLSSLTCMAFRAFWLGEEMVPLGILRRLLDFSGAPYAWYIEMYIGLYLLMPFVNAAWGALGEGERRALVVVLFLLSSLPRLTNVTNKLLPDWWVMLYPLTFYVMGAWLKERPVKASGPLLLAGWLGGAAAAVAMDWSLAKGGTFLWAGYVDYNSPFVVLEAVCLFSLLVRVNGEKTPGALRRVVGWVAKLSLPVYLVSYISDRLLYPRLNAAVPTLAGRLPFLVPVVLCDLALSALIALPIHYISDQAAKVMRRSVSKLLSKEDHL